MDVFKHCTFSVINSKNARISGNEQSNETADRVRLKATAMPCYGIISTEAAVTVLRIVFGPSGFRSKAMKAAKP